ncbi:MULTISPECIES: sulfate/molybdate ABC transporter ATP-binding protein [unclassified Nocardia]|uniref:sulfate/molybdate ABC transporter ATP-binding protein n=1 Tax=unclassified Nocardia TaxID=2637762 RepID=UPI001CE418F2|nr:MULTISPECIES: ATP-binding cassette domain-containing protein [unclassified Nocardia]
MTGLADDPNAGLEVGARLADRDFDVRLEVGAGEVLAVLGPNGAGKSTLLDVIAGLVRPDAGQVRLGGRTLTDTGKSIAVPPHRRGISLLAQDPLLFPHLTVAQNVAFGPRSGGLRAGAARAVAHEWLAAVDALELARRKPGQLSGGQAQRVALARALAVQPRLILLDEPMAALDVAVAPAMRALLRQVLRDPAADPLDFESSSAAWAVGRSSLTAWDRIRSLGGILAGARARRGSVPNDPGSAAGRGTIDHSRATRSAVLVTHDIIDALTLADRLVVIESGRVVESGPVTRVLTRPRSGFAARVAGVNLLVGTAASSSGAGNDEVGAVLADGVEVLGRVDGALTRGGRAAAVFAPSAVAVHREQPEGSPRNTFRIRIAELTDRGGIIRVRGADNPDGSPGLAADLTPAAVAELDLAPGLPVYFAVKATEVHVYPC